MTKQMVIHFPAESCFSNIFGAGNDDSDGSDLLKNGVGVGGRCTGKIGLNVFGEVFVRVDGSEDEQVCFFMKGSCG